MTERVSVSKAALDRLSEIFKEGRPVYLEAACQFGELLATVSDISAGQEQPDSLLSDFEAINGKLGPPAVPGEVGEALKAAKELAAVAVHMTSCRSDDDFVWGIQAKIDAALAALSAGQAQPVAYTSQPQLDRMAKAPGNNHVMWGEPLPHHADIPLYLHPPVQVPVVKALERALDFIESLTADPLLMGLDDIEMTLDDVQDHARIELASIRSALEITP